MDFFTLTNIFDKDSINEKLTIELDLISDRNGEVT